MRDGGRPSEIGLQEQVSNQCAGRPVRSKGESPTAEGYLSEEPGAVTPHAGIYESQQWLIYPTALSDR
jgi:hypothetical protein